FPMLAALEEAKLETDTSSVQQEGFPNQLADYDLIREIGRGGMGVVFEARHAVVGRRVALKILPHRLSADPKAQARFRHEARAVAALHHTNVVPLFELGSDAGYDFLVMQLIEGTSLDRLLSSHRRESSSSVQSAGESFATPDAAGFLSVDSATAIQPLSDTTRDLSGQDRPQPHYRRIASLGMQISAALDHAHRRGIIHRDVKPSNILIDTSGTAWLTDFGLAKTDDEAQTQTGDFVGTLRYSAPERFAGRCDEQSDQYALGLTLYECIALHPAFEMADRIQLIHAIETSSFKDLRRVAPDAPVDLVTIVEKSLQHDPSRRYASAADLSDDLQRYLADEPIRARQLSLRERWTRWRRRNTALANLLAATAALLVLVAFGAVIASFREAGLRRQAKAAGKEAIESRAALQRMLYFAEMNLSSQALAAGGGISRIEEWLDHWDPKHGVPDMRGWEWHYMRSACRRFDREIPLGKTVGAVLQLCWRPDGGKFALAQSDHAVTVWDQETLLRCHSLQGHSDQVHTVAWSPDGTKLASGSLDRTLRIWDAETGEQLSRFEFDDAVSAVAWAPNSQRVALGVANQIHTCDLNDDQLIQQVGEEQSISTITNLQWSPDGSHVFAANWWGNDGAIWSVRDGRRQRRLPGWLVTWKPESAEVENWFSTDATGTIRIWRSDENHPVSTLSGHTSGVRSLAVSPDGTTLLSSSIDLSIRAWDLKSGKIKEILLGHRGEVFSATWSPDGTRILSSGKEPTVYVWEGQTSNPSQLNSDFRVETIDWHPTDQRLLTTNRGGMATIWETGDETSKRRLTGYPNSVTSARWSRDGKRIATSHRDGTVQVWDPSSGERLLKMNGHQGEAVEVAWSPDGKTLVSTGVDARLCYWDLTTESTPFFAYQAKEYSQCVRFSPCGKWLAVGTQQGRVMTFDIDNRLEVRRQWRASGNAIVALSWSPDSQALATSGVESLATIWEPSTGERVQELRGHFGPIWEIDWNRAGDRIATCSRDGTVRVWEPRSGAEAIRLQSHRRSGGYWCVRWSPDDQRIAAGSSVGMIPIWNANRTQMVTSSDRDPITSTPKSLSNVGPAGPK
ncbi:MAG: serine/threonine-protein kinase, partial [Planctomycetota bacterium]